MEIEEPVITETLTAISAVVKRAVPQLDDPMIAHRNIPPAWVSGHGEGARPGRRKRRRHRRRWTALASPLRQGGHAGRVRQTTRLLPYRVGRLDARQSVGLRLEFRKTQTDGAIRPQPGQKRRALLPHMAPAARCKKPTLSCWLARASTQKNCIIVKFMPPDLVHKIAGNGDEQSGRTRAERYSPHPIRHPFLGRRIYLFRIGSELQKLKT